MKTIHSFQVGERVCFAREFLRNTGQVTGDVPFARGTVAAVSKLGERHLVTVHWDKCRLGGAHAGAHESRVLDCNLWPVSKLHLEPV